MPKPTTAKKQPRKAPVTYPLRLSEDLHNKVAAASATTSLSKQDIMRLSIERGLDILVSQLTSPASAA